LLDIPVSLHRQLHDTAGRRGCSGRALIIRSLQRELAEEPGLRPRIKLPLVAADGDPINPTQDEIYNVLLTDIKR
jgi:hypothetical protein